MFRNFETKQPNKLINDLDKTIEIVIQVQLMCVEFSYQTEFDDFRHNLLIALSTTIRTIQLWAIKNKINF